MRHSQSADLALLLKSSGLRPSAASDLPAKKKAALGSTTWLRIDPQGEMVTLEVDKYAIMHRVGIHARDLRILDPLLSYPSTILGRERAIVLNLENIMAIITADEVLLRNAKDEDVVPFINALRKRLAVPGIAAPRTGLASEGDSEESEHDRGEKGAEQVPLRRLRTQKKEKRSPSPLREQHAADDSSDAEHEEQPPFEFIALEVALDFACTSLDTRTTELENAAYPALDALTSQVSSLNLERVRKLKNVLSRLLARVQKVGEELEQLLDDDKDMADMFLTRKAAAPISPTSSSGRPPSIPPSPTIASRISRGAGSRGTFSTFASIDNDVEELEQLLEAYFAQVEGTLNRLNTLREFIDDTEDYINIQLDNKRNQLIQLELVLSMATISVAIYGGVASMFGMNIPYHWNDDNCVFKWVILVTSVACLIVFIGLVTYARYRRIIE